MARPLQGDHGAHGAYVAAGGRYQPRCCSCRVLPFPRRWRPTHGAATHAPATRPRAGRSRRNRIVGCTSRSAPGRPGTAGRRGGRTSRPHTARLARAVRSTGLAHQKDLLSIHPMRRRRSATLGRQCDEIRANLQRGRTVDSLQRESAHGPASALVTRRSESRTATGDDGLLEVPRPRRQTADAGERRVRRARGASDREWVLIDAGLPGTAGMRSPRAADVPVRIAGIRPGAIVMTHGHFDHFGALESLAGQWDVPVYAHLARAPVPERRRVSYPPPDPASRRRADVGCSPRSTRAAR